MGKANNYLKNVIKSVAYATADVSEQYIPSIKEFTTSNKEFATATYSSLKNPKQAIRRSVKAIQESKIYKTLDYGARNLAEDLRTGNFYNKARKERDELALSGLDTNWDDLSEFGIDDNWESKIGSSSKSNGEITAGDIKIVESIEGSNAALASATVNAVVISSNNVVKNNRANTAMIYTQNERLFGGLHKDITVLGNTMQQMYKFQSAALQNIDKNMSSFFTQESKLSEERNAILKEMLELQRNMYKSASDKEKESSNKRMSNKIRWSDINVNGIPNVSEYFKAVKKNFSNQFAGMIPGFGGDSNMLATFMVSPLEGVMKYVVDGVIPATVKAAAKEFDGTISGIFGNIIGGLGNARTKNEGGLLGTIAKFFGISTSVNRNIDTSRYEKGPIPFDGITRKAIIDVIPTHLRRIEAAITGRPEEMFDYKAGRWVKVASIKKQYDDIKKSAIKRATSDLRGAMNSGIQLVRKGMTDKNDQNSWDEAIEEFEQFLYENNGRFNPKLSASKNGISSAHYPNLYRHYSKIKTIYKDFDRIESKDKNGKRVTRNTRNSIRMRLSGNVLDAKDYEEKQYRGIESDVSDILHMYFGAPIADTHGKYKSNGKFEAYNILKNTTDKLGNTIFDYLQNINKELMWFRLNGAPGGGGYGKKSGRGRGKSVSISDIEKQLDKSKPVSNNYADEASRSEKIRKSALDAITSGKAIDLRDFDVDEQAYLLQLSSMISNDAVSDYRSEIKGYNNNAISGFIDRHLIKTNIKSLKDVDTAIKKADNQGKNTNEVNMDEKEEKFFKKIMKRIGAGESIFGGIVGASAEAFTNLLYTADKAIYEMMYKTEISDGAKKKYKGFMEAMVGKMADIFKEIGDKFNKTIIEPFKERLGIDDKFKGRFKKSLINTGSKIWTAFKDANTSVYGPAYHELMASMGFEDGQTRAQKRRASNRGSIKSKVSKANSTKNIYDNGFDALLREYGLNPAEFGTVEEAKSVLLPLLYEEMYKNSNGLKEFDDDDEILDIALKALKGNHDHISKAGKRMGFVVQGDTDEERIAYIKKQIHHRKDKSRKAKNDRQEAVSKAKDSETLRELLAEEYGFVGSIEEKQEMLKALARDYGVVIKDISRYNTDDKLNKSYIRIIENHNAKGTPSGKPFSGLTTLTKGEGLISGRGGMSIVPKTGVYKITTPTHIINRRDMAAMNGRTLSNASIQNDLGKEKLAAKSNGFRVKTNAKGTMKITNSGVDVDTKEFLSEIKKYIPEAASGGLIGGILSLVLGTVGGPLLGAAVGAGGSILASSSNLKEKLFGKAGSDGKRDGSGIISKSIVNTFNRYFPDMLKYGLAGIIPGLITPLGPIGGLMAGAAFGFLKNNERFTNKYFGENGKLTLKSKEKRIIQNMLPGALKGAGVGALATLFLPTPFGIVGNAVLGSAIGIMASTEEFKEGILGKKINGIRVGGLANTIKDSFTPLRDSMKDLGTKLIEVFDKNIIDPIARFVTPAIHAIPQIAAIIPRKINEHFMNSKFKKDIGGFIQDNITTPLGKVFEKILNPITKTVMNAITSPVRLLGWAGDKIRGRQIKTGNADYMTARERVEWMKQHGKGKKVSATDRVLADIGTEGGMSVDEASKMSNDISSIISTKKDIAYAKKAQEKKLNKILDGYKTADGKKLSAKVKKKLRPAIEAGDMDTVRKILSTYALDGSDKGLTEEQIKNLFEGDYGLGNEMKAYMRIKDKEKAVENLDKEQVEGELGKLFEKLGIDPKKVKDKNFLAKFAKNLETEILDREANKTGEDEVALETENNELFKDMASTLTSIKNILHSIATGDTDGLKEAGKKHDADYGKAMDDLDEDYGKRKYKAEAEVGEGLSDKAKDNLTAHTRRFTYRRRGKRKYVAGWGHIPFVGNTFNKTTKKSKDLELIKKYKMTVDEVNACGGDVFRLSEIMREGYRVNTDAIGMLNKLTLTQFQEILKFIKPTYIRRMLIVRNITKEDIEFFLSNYSNIKLVNNKCEYILKVQMYDPKQFESLEEVMSFEGDRTGKGMEKITPESFGKKVQKKVKKAAKFIFKGSDDKKSDDDSDNEEPPVEQNAIGSIILGGLGSLLGSVVSIGTSILGGATSLLGGALKGIGSLFKGRDKLATADARSGKGGLLAALTGMGKSPLSNPKVSANGGSGLDETDKEGDGKDIVHVGGGDFIQIERDSSGNVQPDTADSNTKVIMDKLSLKEKAAEKLQAAQLKANELIKTTFDTSGIKESKGGKIGWLGLLLTGGLLWKSGLLQKLFDGFIKPIWTDHIKPWITDTAVPWISNFWSETVVPWFTDTVVPAIGDLLTGAVELLISALPDIISGAVKGIFSLGGSILDAITGNKFNAGAVTRVNGKTLVKENGEDFVTGMYDENGKALTAKDIADGNFKEIYNAQGIQGTVNEDGTVSFKDDSKKGASYKYTVVNAGVHGLAKTMASGRSSTLVAKTVSAGMKLLRQRGIVKKGTGVAIQALTRPVQTAEKAGLGLRKLTDQLVDSSVEKILAKEGLKEGTEAYAIRKAALSATDGSRGANMFKKFVDNIGDGPVRRTLRNVKNTVKNKVSNVKNTIKSKFKFGAKGAAKEGAEQAAKGAAKEGAEQAAKGAAKEASEQATKGAAKEGAEQAAKSATKEAAENVAKGAAKEGAEQAAKGATKETAEQVAKGAVKEATEKTTAVVVKEGAEQATKSAVKETTEVVVKETTENVAKKTATKAATKNGGYLAKLVTKTRDCIAGLFENSTILNKLKDVAESLGVKNVGEWIKKFKNKVTGVFEEGLEKGIKKVGSDTVKKVLAKALAIVFLVTDFITGCDQAESILGVTETSLTEELVAGLINAVCNFLIIPSIYPGTNAIARLIFEFFTEDFEERQVEADKEYKNYVKENGSTWTKEEYLKRKYSVTGAIGGFFSDAWDGIKGVASDIWDGVTGLFKGNGETAKKIMDSVTDKISKDNPKKGRLGKKLFTIFQSTEDNNERIEKIKADEEIMALLEELKNDPDVAKIKKAVENNEEVKLNALGTGSYIGVSTKDLNFSNSYNFDTKPGSYTGTLGSLSKDINLNNKKVAKLDIRTMPQKILGSFEGLIGDITSTDFNFKNLDNTMNKVRDGKISIFSKDYWKSNGDRYDNTLKGVMQKAFTMLTKFINLPILMIKNSLEGFSSDVETIGNSITGNKSSSGTKSNSKVSSGSKTSFSGKIGSFFGKMTNTIKGFFGFGTGEHKYGTGIYSKQIDPSVSKIRFNASNDTEYQTIGDSGCGPAAAVNAIEYMHGRGNNIASAAKFAIKRGYKETNGGTKPGFFTDYFNKNGYSSQTSYNKSDIERNINRGMPTIIMGSNPNGVSSSSPFGKSPHYVTVTGIDGNGNAIVQDPESRYDNQLYPIKSLMKNTSLGVSAYRGKRRRRRYGKGGSIVETLSSIVSNSKVGQAFNLLLGLNDSSSNESLAGGDITSSDKINTGAFPIYDLNDAQLKGVANIIEHEQPGLTGMLAEASLMANLTDIGGDENATADNLVAMATGGWFADGKKRFNNPGSPSDDAIKAAKAVMLYGRRTVPRYVNEHDCFSDLTSVTTDGSTNSIKDRSGYVPFKTKIKNTYGSSYTFYTFPNDKADPFGYTSEDMRKKWGDDCYDASTAVSGLGKNSRFGRSKWGRGNYDEQVWQYLKSMGMTDAGAAGLMGNLFAESGISPNNVENTINKYTGMTDEEYTAAVDNGTIDKNKFLHPKGGDSQYGYGLAQWTSIGRKEGLYNLVKERGVSIADINTQLDWLGSELTNSYSSVLNVLRTSNDLAETSDIVLTKFEAPKDQSSAVKSKRQEYGKEYYTTFTGTSPSTSGSDSSGSSVSDIGTSIISVLSDILINSKVGQAFNLLTGTLSSSSSDNSSMSPSAVASRMVEIASGELGTAEGSKDNDVKYNNWYYGETNPDRFQEWCGAFVSWCANEAGILDKVIPKFAYTPDGYELLKSQYGQEVDKTKAQAGDILFTYNPDKGRISHTGIVSGMSGKNVLSIEGNWGEKVSQVTRGPSELANEYENLYITRPSYDMVSDENVVMGETADMVTNETADIATVMPIDTSTGAYGRNGIKPLSKYGQFRNSIYGRGNKLKDVTDYDDSHLRRKSVRYKASDNSTTDANVRFGMGSVIDYSKLISSIINILMTIADNTDKLNIIVSILNNKLGTNISASEVSNATTGTQSLKSKLASALNGINSNTSKFNTYADNIGDSSINSIILAMNTIASE